MPPTPVTAVKEEQAPGAWGLRRLALATVVAWAGINFVLVYQHILLPKGLPHWDEAAHSLQGLIIAGDLRTGDWLAFLYDSYRQVYWPPVFSWISGAFFLALGTSAETARLSSLVWMLPLPVVLFLAGQRLQPSRSWVAGLLAAGLALTSPFLADMGSYAMLEMPGLLAFSLALWLYLRLLDRPSVLGAVFLGLVWMLTYLTKSNYGVLLVLAVVVERLFGARLNPRAAFWETPARYAFLVLGAAFLLWFAYPAKLGNSWTALVNSPYGPDAYTLEGLLFYPKALAALVGPNWLLAVVSIATAVSLTRLADPKVRFLVIFLLIQMVFAAWSATKLERHIATMLPPLFLLAAYWLAWLTNKLWTWNTRPTATLAVLVPALLVAASSQAFYAEILSRPVAAAPEDREAFALVREIADLSRRDGPLLLASTIDLTPPQIDWYLAVEGEMSVWAAGSLKETEERRWQQGRLKTLLPPLAEALGRLQDRSQEPAVTRTLYTGFPMDVPQLMTEVDYAAGIQETARRYQLRTVAVVQTRKGAPYYQKGLVEEKLSASGYRLIESKDFRQPASTVKLYVRD